MAGQSTRHRSDLVEDAKLNTTFMRGTTRHLYLDSSTKSETRKAMIEERWTRERELGNGTYGQVWLERCVLGPPKDELRAVKSIVKNQSGGSFNDCTKELEAIAKFSHRNYAYCFVQSSGWFENDDHVYIAMEFMALGDLQKHLLAPFPETQTGTIISQLLEGLQFMHTNDFTHRDLKPSNILVHRAGPDWWVKIGDFGISKRADNDSTALRTVTGTIGYIAPEVFGFHPAKHQTDLKNGHPYTSAVDIWSLGEICFRMITNQPTFATLGQLSSYVSGTLHFPTDLLETSGASPDCIDFIRLAMSASPSLRPSAEVASAHAWIGLQSESFPAPEIGEIHSKKEVPEPQVILEPSAAWSTLPSSDGLAVPERSSANAEEDLCISDELLNDKPSSKKDRLRHGSTKRILPVGIRTAGKDYDPMSSLNYAREYLGIDTGKPRKGHNKVPTGRPAGNATSARSSRPRDESLESFSRRRLTSGEEEQTARLRRRIQHRPEEQARRNTEYTPEEQAAHDRRKAERRARREYEGHRAD